MIKSADYIAMEECKDIMMDELVAELKSEIPNITEPDIILLRLGAMAILNKIMKEDEAFKLALTRYMTNV